MDNRSTDRKRGVSESQPQIALKQALYDRDACMWFKSYLDKCFSTENLYFWIEVEVFKQSTFNNEELKKRAREIFSKYFDPDSVYELNVPHNVLQQLQKCLDTETSIITSSLFNSAQESVFNMMALDSWQSYKKSSTYQEYLAFKKQKQTNNEDEESVQLFWQRMFTTWTDRIMRVDSLEMLSSPSMDNMASLLRRNTSRLVLPKEIDEQDFQEDIIKHLSSEKSCSSGESMSLSVPGSPRERDHQTISSNSFLQMSTLNAFLFPLKGVLGALTTDDNNEHSIIHTQLRIPEDETIIMYYTCQYKGKKKKYHAGKLYVTKKRLCFLATSDKIKTFNWESIVSITKEGNSRIEIKTLQGEKLKFSDIKHRDDCAAFLERERRIFFASRNRKNTM